MANEQISKVIFGGRTLIDLTGDTVTASDVINGRSFHAADGSTKTGTCTYDADTSDANAVAAEILSTKTAYVNGNKITGNMPNRGAISGKITTKSGSYTIQNGYHDGSGSVSIDSAEQAKIIPANIREGVTILGVQGTMSGSESVNAQAKTVTPYTTQQVVTPDSGYNYLSQVTVSAIAYTETANAAGGLTATIGTVAPA